MEETNYKEIDFQEISKLSRGYIESISPYDDTHWDGWDTEYRRLPDGKILRIESFGARNPAEGYYDAYDVYDHYPAIFYLDDKKIDISQLLKYWTQLVEALSKKTVVTHFGADLDNVASIEALERYARENGILEEGEHLEVLRVPAGKVMEGYLNVDTGGHKGSKIEDGETIVIDGDPYNGINSAAAMLSTLGVYVPEQIVELADTVPNKVNPLESRTALSLIRSASGATIFEIAEAGLLDKQLTDEQLKQYGLEGAHEKQKEIIEKAVEKINKYMKTLPNGEKIVVAPEQILGGAQIAYELGASFYASAESHKSGEGSTFAITSKPGIQLPEEIKEFGRGLVEQYKNSDGTSGVFLNPNGQMLVAGGPKNPEFAVKYTLDGLVSKITELFGIEETKPHTYQGIAGMLEDVKEGEVKDTLQQLVEMGEPDKTQEDGKLPTDND